MSVVICEKKDCANKGKETCTAGRVKINEEGECTSYHSFEKLMKNKPRENWR